MRVAFARVFPGLAVRCRAGRFGDRRRDSAEALVWSLIHPFEQRVVRGARGLGMRIVDEAHHHVAVAVRRRRRSPRSPARRASVPVLMCALPPAPWLVRRLRMVPSTPAIGSDCTNTCATGLALARCSRSASDECGDVLVAREARAVVERQIFHVDAVAAQERLDRARRLGGRRGRLRSSAAPIVRNRLRAIVLLLNLLMSRTMSDSTGP